MDREVRMLSRLAILLLAAIPVLAQSTGTATVVGTVTDSTGAVIPGVKVRFATSELSLPMKAKRTPLGATTFPICRQAL